MYNRKKYLIVDGYNVLRSGNRYQHIDWEDYTHDTFNRIREELINDVISFANSNFSKAIIVFDGAQNMNSTGVPQTIGGVQVIFSPSGSSADKVIEKLAREYREKQIETIVVTSDASIQDAVFGGGIDRMSAMGFCLELERHFDQARLDEQPKIPNKNTVSERIDATTRAKLIKLRDSWR